MLASFNSLTNFCCLSLAKGGYNHKNAMLLACLVKALRRIKGDNAKVERFLGERAAEF